MRILPSTAGLALVALLLTGCLPPQPVGTPTPLPSSTPVFASDEDALAAAEAAYARYSEVSDQIAADGGANPERLAAFVTREWLAKEVDVFETFAKTGRHLVGSTKFFNVQLQQLSQAQSGRVDLSIYLCLDSSGTSFVDANGADVTPVGRTPVSLEVSFESSDTNPDHLLLSNSEPWSGDSFC